MLPISSRNSASLFSSLKVHNMPAAKTKYDKSSRRVKRTPTSDVLTLPEVATYLRLPQSTVLALVSDQSLPGRQIGSEWRFLRTAVNDWLRMPTNMLSNGALLAISGNWKDDPYLDQMLKEIYDQRGRPMLENGE